MKKPTKLNLNELKVESFVTSLEGKGSQTIKGGGGATILLPAISIVTGIATVAVVVGLSVGLAVEYYVPLAPGAEKK